MNAPIDDKESEDAVANLDLRMRKCVERFTEGPRRTSQFICRRHVLEKLEKAMPQWLYALATR